MPRLMHPVRIAALVTFIGLPAVAQAQQSVSFYLGGFSPKGASSRTFDDVLFNEQSYLLFNLDGFDAPVVGGEFLIALGNHTEAGAGVGIYSETQPSTYAALVSETGAEIPQELNFRIVPITFTYRFLPLGRRSPIQPYIGAGVGVFSWRYAETGQFVDADSLIFSDRFQSSGTDVGPLIVGGARFSLGKLDLGGEIRYQSATGDLDPLEFGAVASKIDLGGLSYLATFNVRF
jgi:hypothetical protein